MTFRQSALLLLTAASIALLTSCSSSLGIGLGFSPAPPASMAAGSQVPLSVITNDRAGVTWSSSCSNPGQCGSFIGLALTSTTFQAPVAIPSTLTVTATSVTDTSKSKTATITITQATTLNDGNYVYQLSGEDVNGPFNVSGAFTVTAGAITGGEQDFVDASIGPELDGIVSGTIAAGAADSNLQIVLTTSSETIGVGGNGIETINLTQTDPVDGLVTWFDGFAAGSGTLITQNTAAAEVLPVSGYALLTSGWDSGGCPIAIGAVINADGPGTISGDGSILDANDCGSGSGGQGQTVTGTVAGTGDTALPDAFGRVVFTLNPNVTFKTALAGYIVNSSQIDLVETADTLDAVTGGIAYAQASADVGAFSGANLFGFSYAVSAQGEDSLYLNTLAGSLTFTGTGATTGTVSGTADYNDITNQYTATITAGTYSVDPTGDVTVTGLVLTDADANNHGPFNLQFYLDGNGNAVSASMDITDVTSGPAYQQTSGAGVAGAYASGAGGFEPVAGVEWSAVGPITVSSTGAVAGFTDFNYFSDPQVLTANVPLSGTITAGSGTITGLGAVSPTTADTFDFYVIDSNRVFGIETDDTQLGLTYSQFQN